MSLIWYSVSWSPASIKATLIFGSADRRLAKTHPAVPPPTEIGISLSGNLSQIIILNRYFTGVCDSVHGGGGGRGVCGRGVCVVGGCGGGACVVEACVVGGMCGRGVYMVGGMRDRRACVAGGHVVGGHAWQGVCMEGGHVWQEKRPLQRAVRILLECILF